MKKYLLIVLAGIIAVTACQQEKTIEPEITPEPSSDGPELVPMTFKASLEDLATKSDIQNNFILWEDTDMIAIFDGSALQEFSVSALSPSGKGAEFSGSAASVSEYYAVAPYEAATNLSTANTRISVTIPHNQTIIGSHCVDSKALVSTGVASGTADLNFENQFSLMKVTVTSSNIMGITVMGNNNESIAGTSHFYYDGEGAPKIDLSNAGQKQITITYKATDGAANSAFPAGDYYIAIWPTEFSKGYSIILVDEDGGKSLKSASSVQSLARNGGQNLSTVDDATFCPPVIMTAAQLKMWRRLATVGVYEEGEEVKLGADINLGGYTWTPVPNFKGIFNGQDHKIYNFTIGSSSDNCMGFIRVLGTSGGVQAEFKNVILGSSDGTSADGFSSIQLMNDDCNAEAGPSDLKGWSYAGVIGYAKSESKITNVINFVPVSATASVTTKHAIGGIVGGLDDQNIIQSCINYAPITDNASCATSDESAIGGVIGCGEYSYDQILNCQNYGDVTNTCVGVPYIGGIMGKARGRRLQMTECFNHGDITNSAASVTGKTKNWDYPVSVGGILGYFWGDAKTEPSFIDKCSNDGDICMNAATNENYFQSYGGVVGSLIYQCSVRGCSNSGKIYDDAEPNSDLAMGGIVGSINTGNAVVTKAEDETKCVNDGPILHNKLHNKVTWFGGIAGLVRSTGAKVEYCINNGRLVSYMDSHSKKIDFNYGGICGAMAGTVQYCTNNGYVFSRAGTLTAYIGGICAGSNSNDSSGKTYHSKKVLDCTNNGYLGPYNANGSSITGGIIAYLLPSSTEVRRCTNTGMITTGNINTLNNTNTPRPTITSFQNKDYYMGGLFGRVDAPTSNVTDNFTDCIVACTIKNSNSGDKDDWTGLIAGKTFSSSSTSYQLVFGTTDNPIQIVNTCSIEFDNASGSNETITTTALANKWLMGSSSPLYDATNGSSNTSKVDFNYSIIAAAQAGIE